MEQVEKVQNRITQSLQAMMAANHSEDPALFAKLLMKIPDLRTLNTLHSEKLLGTYTQSRLHSVPPAESNKMLKTAYYKCVVLLYCPIYDF